MAGLSVGQDAEDDLQMWGEGQRTEERPLVVAAPQQRLTPEWALLYHAQVLHLEWERWPGDGGLVGSRCLADNWKVPVLARPSVPCAYLPATFCLPQKGPALFHGTRARRLAGGGGAGSFPFCLCLVPSSWCFGAARCVESLQAAVSRPFGGELVGGKRGCGGSLFTPGVCLPDCGPSSSPGCRFLLL